MQQAKIQVDEVTPALIREAVAKGERLMVFDGGEPMALITGSAAELGRHRDYFTHYPHEGAECFNTCWRHDPEIQAAAAREAEAEAKAEAAAQPAKQLVAAHK